MTAASSRPRLLPLQFLTLLLLTSSTQSCSPDDTGSQEAEPSPLDSPFPDSTGPAFVPNLGTLSSVQDGRSSPTGIQSSGTPGPSSSSASTSAPGPSHSSSSASSSESEGQATSSSTSGAEESSSSGSGESGSSGSGSSGSGSSDSGESSDATDTGATPPEIDPEGPQFGYRLSLSLPGPRLQGKPLRALIFEIAAKNGGIPSPEGPDPDLSYEGNWDYQPSIRFNAANETALILPTPERAALDPVAKRAAPISLAIYVDTNQNKTWDSNEPFVAALPQSLIYAAAREGQKERWGRVAHLSQAGVRTAFLHDLDDVMSLTRLDKGRLAPKLRGRMSDVAPLVGFMTTVSPSELVDLENNFLSVSRGEDLHLRASADDQWSFQNIFPPALERRSALPFRLPGIRPNYRSASWVVGYSRPLGAPLEAPGTFLTPDSTLLSGVCDSMGVRFNIAAIYIEEGGWANSPLGALYAAWLNLGVGWSYVPVESSASPYYLNVADGKSMVSLVVDPERCPLPQ